MSVFVSEFAAQRGMSKAGVYKAIKRHNIPTYQGVANGKSAQFMTDEDAQRLNELLGPTESSNLIMANQLQVQIANLNTEHADKMAELTDRLHREKEDEMEKTREAVLNQVETTMSSLNGHVRTLELSYKERLSDKDKTIAELKDKINALECDLSSIKENLKNLTAENAELRKRLSEAQEHPYKNLKAAWDRKKETKKDGKSGKIE